MIKTPALAAYGFTAFPLAALTLPVYIFLPTFYAQNLGIGFATVGFMLLLARSWDVMSDLLAGILSDKYSLFIGRRKGWVIAGAPLLLISTWFLLIPPPAIGPVYLLIWSVLLYTGWSFMILPLNAMGAELSHDYNERTKIAAWREGATVAGVLSALALIASFGAVQNEQAALALKIIAFIVLILTPLSLIFFIWKVPEPKNLKNQKIDYKKSISVIWENAPFKKLIVAYIINGLANGLPATLFLVFVEQGLDMQEEAGPLLFIYFLCGVLSVPFWSWLSTKYGKHKVWCYAMLWACAFFLLVPFVSTGDYWLFLAICILTGFSLGADLVLPASMQADVVDIDTAESGQQRTGLYFAFWGMATKISLALAAGIAFPLLEWSNMGLLVPLYALVPIALKLVSIWIMWSHKLNENSVNQTQKKIQNLWSS